MKKTLMCLWALSLALTCLAPALALEAADVVGAWYLTALASGGDMLDPATAGLKMTLTLHEDGSTRMEAMQAQDTGAWTLAGDTLLVRDNESVLHFTLAEDGSLRGEIGGMSAIFRRERAPEAYVPAPVVPAAALSDFDGEWLGRLLVSGGVATPTAQAGVSCFASISAGAIRLRFITGAVELATESRGTLEDGALFAVRESEGEEEQLLLQLREDGWMSITISGEEDSYQAFFEHAVPPGAEPGASSYSRGLKTAGHNGTIEPQRKEKEE